MLKTKRAPKTNVINFPNAKPVDYNVTIRPDGIKGNLFSHTIASDCLQKFGVNENDKIIFTDDFDFGEIKPLTICLLEGKGFKQACPVYINDGKLTAFGTNSPPKDTRVTAVGVQLIRSLI